MNVCLQLKRAAALAFAVFAIGAQAAAPSVSATFTPSTQFLGNKGALRVVVSNLDASTISGVNYSASLPAGLNFAFHTVGTDCTGEFFAGPDGNTLYVSSLSMPGSTTCTIDVFFLATAAGTYTHLENSISVSSSAGSATNPSPSSVTVILKPPGMQIFLPSTVALGTNASMTIALSRSSGDPNYFSVGASLGFPGGSTVANPSGFTAGCSASGADPAGGTTVTTSGGSISVNGSCALASLLVAFPAAGTYTFTIPAGSFTYQVDGSATVFSNAASVTASIVVTSPAASLSTSSLAFGNQVVGTSSASQQVTVTNSGNANLVISMFSIATGYSATACSGLLITLIPGQTCTFTVAFTPTASSAYPGALEIYTNAPGSPHSVALSGNGMTAPPAMMSLSPASMVFGSVQVGTSGSQPLTITNNGGVNLTLSSVMVSGSTAFSATGCGASVAPGSSCTLNVTFMPTASTAYAGQLTITSNASNSPQSVLLSGNGVAPTLAIAPSPADFGSVVVGTSASVTLNVTNTGSGPITVSAVVASGTGFAQTNTCLAGVVNSGASCQITVTFSPTATGTHSGSVGVTSNASGSPHTVSMSGTGTAPGVSLTPSPIAFGNVPVGGNASATLDLANTGTAPLLISGIVTSGTFFSNTTTCGSSLPAGASCPILVTYAPGAAGAHSGQVSVTTNAGAGPVVAPLSGTGAVPVLTLSGSSLDFGSQTVGTASLTQPVTITNTGGAPLNLSAIAASGDFNFVGCPTPLSLAPGASCTLSIKFLPTAVGARSGGISIGSNAGGTPHAIALTGNGTPVPVPGIALAPGSAAFGAIVTGTNSTLVLVLSNPGTAPLAISSIGTTGAGFSQTNTCPTSLAPSAACNISVKFAPTVEGAASGQLAIVSNAAPSPLNAALSGSGLPATTAGLTFSAGNVAFPPQFVGTTSAPLTATLTSSGTAPLVITQVTGGGDFSFTGCGPSTLAPNATCTFTITFRPQTVGSLTGSIVVSSNAAGSPHTLSLSGNGASLTAPEISLSPSAFGFGTLRTARTATVVGRLTNTGAATLAISQIQATGGFFTQSNNCPAIVVVGGFCDITVTYSPTAAGAHSGQLLVHSNTIPSPFVAALSGTGIVVPPPFLSPGGPVLFGQQVIGTTTRRSLVLTNTGGDPLVISSIAIVGPGAFGVEGGCGTIAPEASCTLTVTFLPTGITPFAARLDIVSNHSGGVVQVALSGQGVALPQPDLEFSSTVIGYFPNRTHPINFEVKTVRLTNVGGAPVTINAIRMTLPDYGMPPGVCVGVLQPQASCDIPVSFRPFTPGPRLGTLFVDSTPAQSDSVSLVGTGCRPYVGGRSLSQLCSP